MSKLLIAETHDTDKKLLDFLGQWKEDIYGIFSHFSEEDMDYSTLLILKYEGKDVGVFVYESKGEELHIHLDYIIPEYRDRQIGLEFFTQKKKGFIAEGYKVLVTLTNKKIHKDYIKSLGFNVSSKHPDRYELSLA